ncbi:uncharacterized protein LOC136082576 [Hydra vulgaris]|uniref:Uncharacterized protein LOC136082576 n=1 Tax=Hydra vulgaris TaxID=6087 RepID=A0ABM4C8W2_HYDVU
MASPNTQKVSPNSSWTTWSSYSDCSASCDSGTSSRSRICYSPANNLPTQGCIGINVEVQTCNEGICPKSCNVNTNITCSNINQPVILDDMSQTMQDIYDKMSWWSWAVTTSLFKSCNPADYNYTLLKLNDYISFVTATMDNIFLYLNGLHGNLGIHALVHVMGGILLGKDYKACNTQSCSNVLCNVLKNRDCSTVSKSALDPPKFLNVSSVNNVISEVSVWPFLITDELFKSCNLDTLVDQLNNLNKQMAMAYSARNNTLAHLEQIQNLIVCTANSFVPSLYDMCLDAAQQDTVLNAIVNRLTLYAQHYQTAIDACKSCGFACSIINSFIQVFFKSGV